MFGEWITEEILYPLPHRQYVFTLQRSSAPTLGSIESNLTTHIPNKGEQLIRYYGYCSNVSRGKRKKEKPVDKTEISEIDAPPVSKELKKRWSYFIRKVYETDPLICPKCQGEMRIISFIDQPGVIKKFFNPLVYGKSPTPS